MCWKNLNVIYRPCVQCLQLLLFLIKNFFVGNKHSIIASKCSCVIFSQFARIDFWGQYCHSNDTFHNHGDTVLGNASTFLGVSVWYTRALSNSKQSWCRHQAGVESPLKLATIWLAPQCLILHRSFTQRGRPPSRARWRIVLSAPYCYTALLWVFLLPAWSQWN